MGKRLAYAICILLILLPAAAFAGGDIHISGWDIAFIIFILFYLYLLVPAYNVVTILSNIFSADKLRYIVTRIVINAIGLATLIYINFLNKDRDKGPISNTMKYYLTILSIIFIVDVVRLFTKRLNIGISLTE